MNSLYATEEMKAAIKADVESVIEDMLAAIMQNFSRLQMIRRDHNVDMFLRESSF
jgi:hypothetical protein